MAKRTSEERGFKFVDVPGLWQIFDPATELNAEYSRRLGFDGSSIEDFIDQRVGHDFTPDATPR